MEKSSSLCQVFVEHLLCRCRYVFIGKIQTKSFHSKTFRIRYCVLESFGGVFLDYGSLAFIYSVSQRFSSCIWELVVLFVNRTLAIFDDPLFNLLWGNISLSSWELFSSNRWCAFLNINRPNSRNDKAKNAFGVYKADTPPKI